MAEHFYLDEASGKEFGPFTDEERADLEATARRPIEWRTGSPSCREMLDNSIKAMRQGRPHAR